MWEKPLPIKTKIFQLTMNVEGCRLSGMGDVAGKWWESVQGGQDEPHVLNKLQRGHE